jgi:hypothetical protein
MFAAFPGKIVTNKIQLYEKACLYFLTPKSKICKKVYFRAIKNGQERF